MSSSRWEKIEELFHAAREREAGARPAFLAEACRGDPELRREVESLLASADAGFLDRPAMEVEAELLSREPSGALSGREIAHYRIGPLLGEGGMAAVYRARDTRLDRDVAIKVLLGSSSLDADGIGRFKREAKILASVTHTNVAAIHGFEQVDDMCALVMELIEGETLSDRIRRQRPSIDEALAIAGQVAAAIEAAHTRNIIHCDLKPANIRLARDGTAKVLDFGLARMFRRTEDGEALSKAITSTQSYGVAGTAGYMSPEQARGYPVDRPTDVWAFGCVLYEMLTGERAFEGIGLTDIIAKIASEDPDWTKLPSATPAAVRSVLKDCLQKDSLRRPRDIAEVRLRITGAGKAPTPSISTGDISLSVPAARALFLIIQVGLLTMYFSALYYVNSLNDQLAPIIVVTAMSGIAVRLFLVSSVALAHPAAGRKFNRLFPILLLLDGAWAASPLLAVPPIPLGVALAGAAALAYVPFSQRTLMRRIYGE